MKKKILVIITAAILTIGAVNAVYAKENINANKNNTYNSMTDLMKDNGFETAAEAMENRDFKAMDDFMNNMTDDQYNQMIDVMKNNGYGSMGKMMEDVGREEMIEMHKSMGGAESCHGSNINVNGMMGR